MKCFRLDGESGFVTAATYRWDNSPGPVRSDATVRLYAAVTISGNQVTIRNAETLVETHGLELERLLDEMRITLLGKGYELKLS